MGRGPSEQSGDGRGAADSCASLPRAWKDDRKLWDEKRGERDIYVLESGEGLCRPTLPDWGDAKPGGADTSTQIT